jgi:hypothetical protein
MLAESEDGFGRIMEIIRALKNFSREEKEGLSDYDLNAGWKAR